VCSIRGAIRVHSLWLTRLTVISALLEEKKTYTVETFADQYTQPPPTITKPEPNVIIRLCDISSNSEHSSDFRQA
jgi:hypothetical protein